MHDEGTNIFDLVNDPADCTANPKIGEIVLFTGRIAGESFEGITNEYYTNANGAQLHLRNNVHLTVTGQGRVALDRPLVWECIGG